MTSILRRKFLTATALSPLAFILNQGIAQADSDRFFLEIISRINDTARAWMEDPSREVQIVCSLIDRSGGDKVKLHTHRYQVSKRQWFFPASTVKLPMSFIAAEKIAAFNTDLRSQIVLNEKPRSGLWLDEEPLAESYLRTIRRIFTTSENIPYNRLYEFLGADAVHERLAELGYRNTRLISRLGSRDPLLNRQHVAIELRGADGSVIIKQSERNAAHRRYPFGKAQKGKGFMQDDGSITPGPHDFSYSNFMPLEELHGMLSAFVFPQAFPKQQRWRIPAVWRKDILREMARYPRESQDPTYVGEDYTDNYAKFFVLGENKANAPEAYRAYGKIGQAYGYMIDSSYLVDRTRNIECILSAVIYLNSDGIFNDDKYEYDNVGYPFFGELGRAVLAYEAERPKKNTPDFSALPW